MSKFGKLLSGTLFFALMFVRGPIKLILRLLTAISAMGTIIPLFADTVPIYIAIIYAGMSFMFFLMSWFYDSLLLKLNPEGTTLILER